MEKPDEIVKTCQNCDFEEYCNHSPAGRCPKWRPDLEYKKMMETVKK